MAVSYHYHTPFLSGQLQFIILDSFPGGFRFLLPVPQTSSRRGYLTAPLLLYDYLSFSNDPSENLAAYHMMLDMPREYIHILCTASISTLIRIT